MFDIEEENKENFNGNNAGNENLKIEAERTKRFDLLLKQTEKIFSFVGNNNNTIHSDDNINNNISSSGKPKSKRYKLDKSAGTGKNARHQKLDKDSLVLEDQRANCFRFTNSPPYIHGGQMRGYQIEGLNWMISLYENDVNGILADEMGLGKTIQTIALLGFMQHYKNQPGPHIVIVPKSTLQNWMNEFKKWCPSLNVVCLMGIREKRKQIFKEILFNSDYEWHVCVTTYEMCMINKGYLKKIHWSFMVIDEAHRIKNDRSKLFNILKEYMSRNRLLLTGTPLQNNLHELWTLLNFLLPKVFNSSEDFDEWFNTNKVMGDENLCKRLNIVMKPFILRRLKSDVEKDLPLKNVIKVYVGLTPLQREWYKKILMKDYEVITGNGFIRKQRLQNLIMQLRKCTNHPYIFEGAEPGPPYKTDYHLVENCGKMLLLDKLLPKLKAQGSRVLIFSQMTKMLDILEDYCMWRDYKYSRLDGSTRNEERSRLIEEYNLKKSSKFIFMLSTRAGGLGINLYTADVVIIYDSDWNPQMDLQAMDRAHRIGQKKQVRVFRFITKNTVEERIIERSDLKLHLDDMFIQQGRAGSGTSLLSKEGLLDILRFGANHVFSSEDPELTDHDIDVILARSLNKLDEENNNIKRVSQRK